MSSAMKTGGLVLRRSLPACCLLLFARQWVQSRADAEEVGAGLGDDQRGIIRGVIMKARQEAMRVRDEAREQIRRVGDQIRILSQDQNAVKSTKIDIGKARIVFSDDKGELRVEKVDGKKVLTAKALPIGRGPMIKRISAAPR
jgi:uncharacterized membrane protein